jgi:hypothetical protein
MWVQQEMTRLHHAAADGYGECVTLLLEAGAEKEAKDGDVSVLEREEWRADMWCRDVHLSTLLPGLVKKGVLLSC